MATDQSINAKRLLWAGFMAILAAGVGFGVRGGIFGNWATDFGFSGAQLGAIGGAGFTGFCFGIMIGGVIVDKIGYAKLILGAFAFHVISFGITVLATEGQSNETAYQILWCGMFTFALANGILEAVANPLVSTLFPENRTHYLNILHASWPLGMIAGGVIGWTMGGTDGAPWKVQLAFYLIPTVIYGFMFFGQRYPQSEATEKGLKLGEMMKPIGIMGGAVVAFMLLLFFHGFFTPFFEDPDNAVPTVLAAVIALVTLGVIAKATNFSLGHWLLFVLFITHGLVGAVELGTDGWMQAITGAILTPTQGKILFVVTSLGMFLLRFSAHTIESKLGLSPIGILFVSAIFAFAGLNAIAAIQTFGPALGAVLIYSIGKTFFWPTMLAVVGDRFPQTGAVAMSLMGGIGMMSAGLIGSVGLGYFKDRYSAEELTKADTALFEEYKSTGPNSSFLAFGEVTPIDGKKLEEAKTSEERTAAQETVVAADIEGNRRTLKTDSLIPATMAVIFLLLMLYFKGIGGYKALSIEGETPAKG